MEYHIDLDYIRERRQEMAYSQEYLAKLLGFKNACNYFKYEKGTYMFKAVHLPILASLFKCELSDFFIEFREK